MNSCSFFRVHATCPMTDATRFFPFKEKFTVGNQWSYATSIWLSLRLCPLCRCIGRTESINCGRIRIASLKFNRRRRRRSWFRVLRKKRDVDPQSYKASFLINSCRFNVAKIGMNPDVITFQVHMVIGIILAERLVDICHFGAEVAGFGF